MKLRGFVGFLRRQRLPMWSDPVEFVRLESRPTRKGPKPRSSVQAAWPLGVTRVKTTKCSAGRKSHRDRVDHGFEGIRSAATPYEVASVEGCPKRCPHGPGSGRSIPKT